MLAMKEQGSSVAVVTLVAIAVSFTACNRVPGMKPAQAAAAVATQPAPQKPQPSSAAQTAMPSPPQALPASPPLPVAAPKSDASAPSRPPGGLDPQPRGL